MSDFSCEVVVIGAGVVGLAVARALAQAGREVVVLEAAASIGTGISSRNSEVIHAGIYYPPGSLKARLCVAGKQQLYHYCRERQIPHKNCGKLIVATQNEQIATLEAIKARAEASGVLDVGFLDKAQITAREPEVAGVAALFSPSTGIIDSHAFMASLLGDMVQAGGQICYNAPVQRGDITDAGILLQVGGAEPCAIRADYVVNAAGLYAIPLLQSLTGFPPQHIPLGYYAKGSYFMLQGKNPFRHLVYPVPVAAGLGVHATLDMGGQCRFGPDVEWVNNPEDYHVDPNRGTCFYAAVRAYWPGLPDNSLYPGYAGIRPKLQTPDGSAVDFMVQGQQTHQIPGLVNLLGIESPGLTAALALATQVKYALFSEDAVAGQGFEQRFG